MKRLLIILGLFFCATLATAQSYVTGWSGASAYGSPFTSSNLTGLTAGEMVVAYGYGYSGQKPTSVTNTTAGGIPVQTWTSCGIATIPCWYAILSTGGYMGVTFTNSNGGDNYDLGVLVFSGPNTVGVVGTHAATTNSMSATTSGSVNAASGCGVGLTANTAATGGTSFSAGNIGGSAASGSIAGSFYAFGEYQCGTSYSGTLTATATQTTSQANTTDVLYLYYYAAPPTALTPVLSSSTADFLSSMPLVITSATSGAAICYTTDGSTPTATTAGTCSHGTTLTNGGTVTISSTVTTVNAIATESGYTNSVVGTGGPYTVFSTITPVASDNFSSYYNANLTNNPSTANGLGLFWQLPLDVWTTGGNWSFLAGDGLVVELDTVRGGSNYWVVDSGAQTTDSIIERTGEGYYQNHSSTVYVDQLSSSTSYPVGPTVRCSGTHCYYMKVSASSVSNVSVGDYYGGAFMTSEDTNLASGTHSLTLAVVGCVLYPFVDGYTPTGMAVSYTVPSCVTTGQPGIYGGAATNGTLYNWSAGNIGGASSGYTPPTVSYGTYTFPFNTSSFSLVKPWMKYNVGATWGGTLGPVSVTINGTGTYALGNNAAYGAQYEHRQPYTFNQWAAGEIAINAFDSSLTNYFVTLEHQNFIPQYASCTGGACYDAVALYFGMEPLNPAHGCGSAKTEYCGTPFWHVTMVNPVDAGTTDAVATLVGSSTALMKGDLIEVRMVNGWADGFCKQNSTAPPSWSSAMTMTAGTTWIEASGMYWVTSASGTAGGTIPVFPTSATWSTSTYTGTTVTDGSGTWMYWGDACPSQSKYTRIMHAYTANFSPSLTTNLSQALGIGYPGMWGQTAASNMPFITNASTGSVGYGAGEPCATPGACVSPSNYVPMSLIP